MGYFVLEDDLHEMMYIPLLYFKNKWIRWATYYSFIYGIFYLVMLLINIAKKSEKVVLFDILVGALTAEVINN